MKYQGWTNYPTWAVALWIDNDERSQNYWLGEAQDVVKLAVPRLRSEAPKHWEMFTDKEVARIELTRRLKEEHEQAAPEMPNNVYSDLLGWAMEEVYWTEIAVHLLERVEESERK